MHSRAFWRSEHFPLDARTTRLNGIVQPPNAVVVPDGSGRWSAADVRRDRKLGRSDSARRSRAVDPVRGSSRFAAGNHRTNLTRY